MCEPILDWRGPGAAAVRIAVYMNVSVCDPAIYCDPAERPSRGASEIPYLNSGKANTDLTPPMIAFSAFYFIQ